MKYRDLTIIKLNDLEELVLACDSCAGIGNKDHDVLNAPEELVGELSTRVALLELLAYGAQPLAISLLVGNEMNTTGQKIIAGMKNELAKAGCSDIEINGSTEENMTPTVTSVGVTVIGKKMVADKKVVTVGDALFILGEPLVGKEVLVKKDRIVTYEELQFLRDNNLVKDILPIGSKGSLYEAKKMAQTYNLDVQIINEWLKSDLAKHSAGPATAVLVAAELNGGKLLVEQFGTKIKKIGSFVKNM